MIPQPAIVCGLLLLAGLVSSCIPAVGQGREPQVKLDDVKREPIGTVSGKPVYRDQIRTEGFTLPGELHRLFAAPSIETFRKENANEITPTTDEIQNTTENLISETKKQMAGEYGDELRKMLTEKRSKLEEPDLSDKERQIRQMQTQSIEQMLNPTEKQLAFTAKWMLQNWKFQRHIYDKFGGGRIVWQQGGTEAFDAMHNFYKQREAADDFQITDPHLRATFYEYYTNEKLHGAFLTGDKERIQATFLTPLWEQKRE